jgi:hypothetical protein
MDVIAVKRRGRTALPLTVFLAFGLPSLILPPAIAQEKALAPEKNPPGDIPDSQVFVVYRLPQGLSLKVPEGWARKDG